MNFLHRPQRNRKSKTFLIIRGGEKCLGDSNIIVIMIEDSQVCNFLQIHVYIWTFPSSIHWLGGLDISRKQLSHSRRGRIRPRSQPRPTCWPWSPLRSSAGNVPHTDQTRYFLCGKFCGFIRSTMVLQGFGFFVSEMTYE